MTVTLLAAACGPEQAREERTYILATGRRLPYLYAISLDAALDPANDNTAGAIVSRSKVALERLDGQLLGDPANVAVSEDGATTYVVNHHGAVDNAEFRQHGGRGQIAVLDTDAVLDPENDRTATALRHHFDSGGFGAVGIVLLPDLLVVAHAENHLTEDGGNRITFLDRRTGSLRGVIELALGDPGFECPAYPVPFVSPHGPPPDLAVLSPHPSWGCFPDTNGLALGRSSDGRRYLFAANGGTDDVSVIDLERALSGERPAEIHRIQTQTGPWGIAATPDGRTIVVASRESQQAAFEGNTVSIIDVDSAFAGSRGAEVARVLVGTDDPREPTRPFIPSVTPDGREVVVPNFRTNSVSIVDLERVLAGQADAEVTRISLIRTDGLPARPKGSAVTSDGRYAIVSAGPSTAPFTEELGHVYVIDLVSRRVVATVTGVGNDPYGLAVVER